MAPPDPGRRPRWFFPPPRQQPLAGPVRPPPASVQPAPTRSSAPPGSRPLIRRRAHPPRLLRIVAGLIAAAFAVAGALTGYAALTLPSLDGLGRAAGTVRILDRHGAVIAEVGHDQRNRTTVPLAQISAIMQAATLAAEDRGFYDEGAVNYGRVLHALVIDVLAGSPEQGASTITQQLAKLAFLSPDRSPLRKLREALLANQIGERYTKQQILELYLNVINYGEGAYGVEDAAGRYFGVHAAQLDLREASLLAGLPQAPADNDPVTAPENAFARQHYVLGGLIAMHVITTDDAATVDPLALDPATRDRNQAAIRAALARGRRVTSTPAPHFVAYVLAQIQAMFADQPQVLEGSLDVLTTLDLATQRSAESAVTQGVARIAQGANNGALLMLDPGSGDVVAMVGSANFDDAAIAGQYDVVLGQRRPASTFKPLVYATAFNEGRLTESSLLDDTAAESASLGGVQDYDNAYLGRISVREALLGSRNIPAEQAMAIAGVGNVLATAHRLGITSDLAANATTAIGTSAVHMIDLAAAYGAIAAGGTRVTPRAVLRVSDASGNLLYAASTPATGERVLSTAAAQQVTSILRDYAPRWGVPFDRPVAAKSGTTDSFIDAWYVAYTPHWVVTAWAGHTDGNSPAEVGMAGVGGNDVGRDVVAPFVAALPPGDDGFPAPSPPPAPQCHGHGCSDGNG